MTGLESWLKEATRRLAAESAAQVRAEIREHYELARNASMNDAATADDAGGFALRALGDAKTANRQYRRVLVTSAEARMLRKGNLEARVVCSRRWLKRLVTAVPVAIAGAAAALFLNGHSAAGRDVLIAGAGMSPLFAAFLLPICTPARGRVFRVIKWIAITGTLLVILGPETFKWSWLLISSLWPLAWTDWTRASIRRKLPVKAWPRHLYL